MKVWVISVIPTDTTEENYSYTIESVWSNETKADDHVDSLDMDLYDDIIIEEFEVQY